MSSISLGLAGVSFEYNGRGERVRKVHEEFGVIKTTNYLFDEAGHLLVEQFVDGATTTTSEIIWMDGQPVGVIRNNVLRYIEPDHLGTPRQVIDRTRDVAVWRWDLLNDPFGESAPNTNPDADGTYFVFNMRFPGQIHDAESGLNYNYFRDYEPGTGRYMESDPIGLHAGMSTYSYVHSNPLQNSDPSGLDDGFSPNPPEKKCEPKCFRYTLVWSFPDREAAESANTAAGVNSNFLCAAFGGVVGDITGGWSAGLSVGTAVGADLGCAAAVTPPTIYPGDVIEEVWEVCLDENNVMSVKLISQRYLHKGGQ